jgi:hypothetical protein
VGAVRSNMRAASETVLIVCHLSVCHCEVHGLIVRLCLLLVRVDVVPTYETTYWSYELLWTVPEGI